MSGCETSSLKRLVKNFRVRNGPVPTRSPKDNDRSPESHVPRSNVVFSKWSDQNQPRKDGDIIFPHYKSMGAFCCHGN